jgi:AcrR family transcriptional regulator
MEEKMLRKAGTALRRPSRAGKRAFAEAPPGRPRDARIDAEVVAKTLKMLRISGYRSVTIERIARELGMARTSLYRRWPSKRHLVAYTVISELGEHPAPDTGNLREDLQAVVETLLHGFSGPLGQALPGLVGEMAQDEELADTIRQEVLAPRRHSMRAAFARAIERGEVGANLNVELVLDMLTGPFYYRALFRHAPITRQTTSQVVDYVLRVVADTDPA